VLGALGFTGLTATASGVSAAELAWHGPSTCENRAYVAEQAEALSRRTLESAEGLAFEVRVSGAGEAWELVLVTHTAPDGGPRERTFRGRSCAEVSDAAAVAIAMTLGGRDEEPLVATEEPSPSDERSAAPVPEYSPTPAVPAEPPSAADEPEVAWFAAVHAVLDTGALPSVAFGPELALGLDWRRLRLSLDGGVLLPNSAELADDRGGTFTLYYAALFACLTQPLGKSAAAGCVGYELGSMTGEGTGVDRPRLGSALWQAPRFEVGAATAVSASVRVGLGVGLAVPLSRPEFELDQGEVVHRAAAVSGRARAGVALAF
jgi:hypothetical protein